MLYYFNSGYKIFGPDNLPGCGRLMSSLQLELSCKCGEHLGTCHTACWSTMCNCVCVCVYVRECVCTCTYAQRTNQE